MLISCVPAILKKPIAYTVDCIRDGKSSTTRRVVATVSQEGLVCHRTREDNH
jgi:acyl-CoA thioesterase